MHPLGESSFLLSTFKKIRRASSLQNVEPNNCCCCIACCAASHAVEEAQSRWGVAAVRANIPLSERSVAVVTSEKRNAEKRLVSLRFKRQSGAQATVEVTAILSHEVWLRGFLAYAATVTFACKFKRLGIYFDLNIAVSICTGLGEKNGP